MTGFVPELFLDKLDALPDGIDGCVDNYMHGFRMHVLKCHNQEMWIFFESEGEIRYWAKTDFFIQADGKLEVTAGTKHVTVSGGSSEAVGSSQVTISGESSEAIGSSSTREIAGDETVSVGGVYRLQAPRMEFNGESHHTDAYLERWHFLNGGFYVDGAAVISQMQAQYSALLADYESLAERVSALEQAGSA